MTSSLERLWSDFIVSSVMTGLLPLKKISVNFETSERWSTNMGLICYPESWGGGGFIYIIQFKAIITFDLIYFINAHF